MTLGCFPVPVPGELLYGVLARHGVLDGSPDAATHATDLFGRRAAVATFDLPCRLAALAARLPAASGLGVEALLTHTLYPFYATFQPEEGRSAGRHDMLASEVPNAHHRLGVAAFRISSSPALRYCAECMAEQNKWLGSPTWMVVHQLPGVPVCAVHGCMLADSLVTRASAGRHGYVPPSEANCPERTAMRPNGRAGALLTDLARRAAAITTMLRPAFPLDHWREHYVSRLSSVGLMRSPRKVDQALLNGGLVGFWGPALPYLPQPCSTFGERGWAAAMVRGHRKAMHPLLHLMMEGFLDHLEAGGSASLEGARATSASRSKPVAIAVAINPVTGRRTRVDWATMDGELVRRVGREMEVIRAEAPPVRVTAAEIERRIAKPGWFGKRKAKVPLAIAALSATEEALDDFRLRRVQHWITVLGPGCRAWEVMRSAGLRSVHLPMIEQAMVMATGTASAGRSGRVGCAARV
ncbi:hypothetical protein SAQ01S_11260 [Sphingomonas aquatilis NBRC 16722]|uniref:Transposon Tn7 transposition protein TnsD C-termianl domain-containing protein n=1 Tax=Sphingomonas aquatilis TaxID=93063 RepID=A0AAW3TS28_9SPHN|nr:TnsD family Tn7-like transposition protein [Sphingomonas aquatilis]MBB3875880.1 hypothetical protein [Sphingomonas aquatilis]GEM71360.1 hypothetical protein SAQ01S_11260 [Sphingomonas aquatilis NBRC 16722]